MLEVVRRVIKDTSDMNERNGINKKILLLEMRDEYQYRGKRDMEQGILRMLDKTQRIMFFLFSYIFKKKFSSAYL